MPKVTVTIDVEVDPDWIEFCTSEYVDVFMSGYCGYWMGGVEHDPKLGWLVHLSDDGKNARQASQDPKYKSILKAWKAGEDLPEGWHRLNEELATKAWTEGVKKYGTDWFENADAYTYDYVIQTALFGETVYG